MRVLYRLRQFWHALEARPDQEGLRLASSLLTPMQMALFCKLQHSEQAHAIKVFIRLLMQGEEHPDLLAAALLHDCGKQLSPISTLQRVWIVIAQTLFPKRAKVWGSVEQAMLTEQPAWRRALAVAEQHPVWGAELARQTGASPLLQALIRRHQDRLNHRHTTIEDELLHKLQVVDNES
jgi:hypothetical protein